MARVALWLVAQLYRVREVATRKASLLRKLLGENAVVHTRRPDA